MLSYVPSSTCFHLSILSVRLLFTCRSRPLVGQMIFCRHLPLRGPSGSLSNVILRLTRNRQICQAIEVRDHLGIDYSDLAPPRPLKPQISYASQNSTTMEHLRQRADLVQPIRDMTWYLGMPTVCRPVSRAHRHRELVTRVSTNTWKPNQTNVHWTHEAWTIHYDA